MALAIGREKSQIFTKSNCTRWKFTDHIFILFHFRLVFSLVFWQIIIKNLVFMLLLPSPHADFYCWKTSINDWWLVETYGVIFYARTILSFRDGYKINVQTSARTHKCFFWKQTAIKNAVRCVSFPLPSLRRWLNKVVNNFDRYCFETRNSS